MTFEEHKRVAIALLMTQPGFLRSPPRGNDDVVLLAVTERELRFALVSREEAAPFMDDPTGAVLAELRRNPDTVNADGATGYFWVMASLGEECIFFTARLETTSDGTSVLN
jgi:hypothetical protein